MALSDEDRRRIVEFFSNASKPIWAWVITWDFWALVIAWLICTAVVVVAPYAVWLETTKLIAEVRKIDSVDQWQWGKCLILLYGALPGLFLCVCLPFIVFIAVKRELRAHRVRMYRRAQRVK